jgi:hypothetical protein
MPVLGIAMSLQERQQNTINATIRRIRNTNNVHYIDIGGIVDHHCFNVLFIINVFFLKIKT